MLGLFDENRRLNPYYERLTLEKIEQFFQDNSNIKEYKIKFKYIRPGTYYKPKSKCNSCKKDEPEPMYMLSNGCIDSNIYQIIFFGI